MKGSTKETMKGSTKETMKGSTKETNNNYDVKVTRAKEVKEGSVTIYGCWYREDVPVKRCDIG